MASSINGIRELRCRQLLRALYLHSKTHDMGLSGSPDAKSLSKGFIKHEDLEETICDLVDAKLATRDGDKLAITKEGVAEAMMIEHEEKVKRMNQELQAEEAKQAEEARQAEEAKQAQEAKQAE